VLAVGVRTDRLIAQAPDGRRWLGAAAVNRALLELGGFWAPVGRLYELAPVRRLEDAAYGWVARHREMLARYWGDPPEF